MTGIKPDARSSYRPKTKKLGRTCSICGRLWITSKHDRHRPYCSEKCALEPKDKK